MVVNWGKRSIFLLTGIVLGSISVLSYFTYQASKDPLISFPITYSLADVPVIHAKINDNEVLLKLDLGSKYHLFLNSVYLETIAKKEQDPVITRDALGNKYQKPSYKLPSLQVGSLTFRDIIAHKLSQDEIDNSTFWQIENAPDEDKIVGLLGRPVFDAWNYLLDFPHQKFILCNSLDKLKENGYSLEDFIKVPVNCTPLGVVLTFSTDLGQVRLLLDTGCTLTMVRPNVIQDKPLKSDWRKLSYVTSQKFEIGNCDFKNQNIYTFNLSDELTLFDGVLGMDFLKQHILYLHRKDSIIYIK